MVTLTKKYRLIWENFTLNIQNDYERDNTGAMTIITDNGTLGLFESDNYPDILDKIDEKQLNLPGEWVDYNPDI